MLFLCHVHLFTVALKPDDTVQLCFMCVSDESASPAYYALSGQVALTHIKGNLGS